MAQFCGVLHELILPVQLETAERPEIFAPTKAAVSGPEILTAVETAQEKPSAAL